MYSARFDNPESVGVLSQQWVRCGKRNCRCHCGRPHGPYFYLHYRQWEEARAWVHRRRYVRREDAPAVARQIAKNKLQDRAMSNMWGNARRLRGGVLNVAAWLHGPGGQQEPDKNLMPRVDVSRVKPPPAPPWRARWEKKPRPGGMVNRVPAVTMHGPARESNGPLLGRMHGHALTGSDHATPREANAPPTARGKRQPRPRSIRAGAWDFLQSMAREFVGAHEIVPEAAMPEAEPPGGAL